MPRACEICKKGSMMGKSIRRKGLAKKKGGIGQHITGISPRKFKPNLQEVRANVNGNIRFYRICTKCLKAGKIVKAA